ncbi:MAG: hypothetical protein B7Z12_08615, partial [Caulobacter vibrioides]
MGQLLLARGAVDPDPIAVAIGRLDDQVVDADRSVGVIQVIPVSEDLNIEEATRKGYLNIEKLEALTSVCSVGLDMV